MCCSRTQYSDASEAQARGLDFYLNHRLPYFVMSLVWLHGYEGLPETSMDIKGISTSISEVGFINGVDPTQLASYLHNIIIKVDYKQ